MRETPSPRFGIGVETNAPENARTFWQASHKPTITSGPALPVPVYTEGTKETIERAIAASLRKREYVRTTPAAVQQLVNRKAFKMNDALTRSLSRPVLMTPAACSIIQIYEGPGSELLEYAPSHEGEFVPQILRDDSPHRVRKDGTICSPDGQPIPFPWEGIGRATHIRQVELSSEPCCVVPIPRTGLLQQALNESSADGQMGENTTGVRAWKAFTRSRGLSHIRPLDPNASLQAKLREEQLCMEFVISLVEERDVAVGTAANYFGQVQGFSAKKSGVKLAGGLKLCRLPAMLKGLKRILGHAPTKIRRGVAAQALQKSMDDCLDPNDPAHANIRAALAVAFQGLLRSAEYCNDGKRASIEKLLEKLPSRADITHLDQDKLVFLMCPCKNMNHLRGKTVPLIIGAGGKYVDAAKEVANMLRIDGVPQSLAHCTPMFRNPDSGRPLEADNMRSVIKALMAHVGEDPTEFGTHSLRIGGATALFAAGATPLVIRTMGRWSSDCYRLYVRACYEASLEWTRKAGSTVVTDLHQEFDEVDSY